MLKRVIEDTDSLKVTTDLCLFFGKEMLLYSLSVLRCSVRLLVFLLSLLSLGGFWVLFFLKVKIQSEIFQTCP